MSAKSRNKGARGERELLALLSERFPDLLLQRNYDQAAFGGSDLLGLPGISLEVKRYQRENVHRQEWWTQACQVATQNRIPVLAYRFDRSEWQSVLPLQWWAMESVNDLNMIAIMPLANFLNEYELRMNTHGCTKANP